MDLATTCHLLMVWWAIALYNLNPRDPFPKASKAILLGIMGHGKSF